MWKRTKNARKALRKAKLERHSGKRIDSLKQYSFDPDKMYPGEMLLRWITFILCVGYGCFGLVKNNIFLSGRMSGGRHYYGETAKYLAVGFICIGTAAMWGVFLEFIRKRNRETFVFLRHFKAGWVLVIAGFFFEIIGLFVFGRKR